MKYVHLNILIILTPETELRKVYKLLRGISWLTFELQNMLHGKSSKSGSENYARFGMTYKERLWDPNCLMEGLLPKEDNSAWKLV